MRWRSGILASVLLLAGWVSVSAKNKSGQGHEYESVTILASCIDIVATGKRHNSYLFTFKVEKVLEGEYEEKTYRTREHFHDFGGGQMIQKLGAKGIRHRLAGKVGKVKEPKTTCKNMLVMRLARARAGQKGDADPPFEIMWVARAGEVEKQKLLEKFTRVLAEAFEKKQYELISACVTPGSGLSRKLFDEVIAYNEKTEWTDFWRLALGSLITEREGRVFIGGGMVRYWFELVWQKDGGRWVIRKAGKN